MKTIEKPVGSANTALGVVKLGSGGNSGATAAQAAQKHYATGSKTIQKTTTAKKQAVQAGKLGMGQQIKKSSTPVSTFVAKKPLMKQAAADKKAMAQGKASVSKKAPPIQPTPVPVYRKFMFQGIIYNVGEFALFRESQKSQIIGRILRIIKEGGCK